MEDKGKEIKGNSIRLVETSCSDIAYLRLVRGLYESAFPEKERRDWSRFEELVRTNGDFSVFSILGADGGWIGFVTVWRFGSTGYVEHFAIDPEKRSGGAGSIVLSLLQDPLILEVEIPEGEMERRRVGFYERNGFVAHPGYAYAQPPYREGGEWFPLMLMTRGEVDIDSVVFRIHEDVYNVKS